MNKLKDKVALVTGGSRGIGKSIAKRLASEGAIVVINYMQNDSAANETKKEIEDAGGQATISKFDVSDFDTVHQEIDKIIEKFGGLHILINNAGITQDTLLMRMKEDDWDSVISINLKGTFNCTRAVTRNMFKQREGRIINLTSVVGEMGNAGQTNYAASKAGVIGFTKACAREMAPRGITVNAVSPGFIKTDITDQLPEDMKKDYISKIPLNRFGTTEDVAGAVAFLTSDDASYITGEVFRVNGGIYT
ncbi:MAG: 3-oxoacyl-[acyl-carrier-protein] reductase [Candidatus Dadabacteria bacterium]|jgi:3-oxoacyl-[acyl-carrier protein] reductase|nr:3-oxoacyl-[acyl-carrier-protein] reductase [Candidatus Dadabacteria bacterium]MCZ6555986.1 3-oxoacyl-[acyl-carrier-protein] reductase [Candidatus Dadabacteria bacterium]MCZ6685964.1 3-oxoacyl-[acyl-carrier-protein] reductase [Candidatus Dadabacteria bacterium]